MSAGGNTPHSLRRAIGALKDSTTVGLTKVNSEKKELDVAIVKATSHDEVLPKEKHILTIFNSLSAPNPDVGYCIHGLSRRLTKTHSWTVALKTLVVIHRALREVHHSFHEELLHYSKGRRLMLNLSHFRDSSSPQAWDYSAWVRTYALYLEERLECLSVLNYDVHRNHWSIKELDDTKTLLEKLPAMQQLLFRLLSCKPEGIVLCNSLIQYALSIVASESVKLYVAITDGVLNLVDKYFEMERHDAVRALEIYKKAASQGESLSELFEICGSLEFGRKQKYIKIKPPPASFLTAMEDYVAEAPHVLALEWIEINDEEGGTPKEVAAPQAVMLIDKKQDKPAADALVTDLLGLDAQTQEAHELDEKNCLAMALVTSDNILNHEKNINLTSQTTSWELELVTAPNSNEAAVATSEIALARATNENSGRQIGQKTLNPFSSFEDNNIKAASNEENGELNIIDI